MMRLGISVEGATEREFVNRVLKPHLLNYGWHIVKPISLNGGVSMNRVVTEIRLLAQQYEWVTTLYDLYGFQGRNGRDATSLADAIHNEAGGIPNLVPYLQQHEFEALLFSDVKQVADVLEKPVAITQLNKILTECGSPESINHGYNTIPSRRLKKIFPKYDKVIDGASIAEKIGLPNIRMHCPRFDCWLSTLEQIGSGKEIVPITAQ